MACVLNVLTLVETFPDLRYRCKKEKFMKLMKIKRKHFSSITSIEFNLKRLSVHSHRFTSRSMSKKVRVRALNQS